MTTQLDVELAALRKRRHSPDLYAWLRRNWPFERRSIRDPDRRDEYWATVQRRLAESDYGSLSRDMPTVQPSRRSDLIG
jgi:hypothetical protein